MELPISSSSGPASEGSLLNQAFGIALDQPTLLKHPGDARGDLLHQCLQLGRAGCSDMPEYGRIGPIRQIHPIDKDHVEVHVQVQRWISVTAPVLPVARR